MKQQNDAARDLWSQIFEGATADLDAALHAPNEEGEAAQRGLTTYALKEPAGLKTQSNAAISPTASTAI